MFDISFAELVVVGIVALIVIGPERLPAVARTVGYFLGRARRYVDQVKHDLHEEMELDSLRKLRDSMHETVNSFEH
ncbi:Sec-independent protein translocase protein TatB, partial [Nitrosomonas sp.]